MILWCLLHDDVGCWIFLSLLCEAKRETSEEVTHIYTHARTLTADNSGMNTVHKSRNTDLIPTCCSLRLTARVENGDWDGGESLARGNKEMQRIAGIWPMSVHVRTHTRTHTHTSAQTCWCAHGRLLYSLAGESESEQNGLAWLGLCSDWFHVPFSHTQSTLSPLVFILNPFFLSAEAFQSTQKRVGFPQVNKRNVVLRFN